MKRQESDERKEVNTYIHNLSVVETSGDAVGTLDMDVDVGTIDVPVDVGASVSVFYKHVHMYVKNKEEQTSSRAEKANTGKRRAETTKAEKRRAETIKAETTKAEKTRRPRQWILIGRPL